MSGCHRPGGVPTHTRGRGALGCTGQFFCMFPESGSGKEEEEQKEAGESGRRLERRRLSLQQARISVVKVLTYAPQLSLITTELACGTSPFTKHLIIETRQKDHSRPDSVYM